MAVFKFSGIDKEHEDSFERGTVRASDAQDAKEKLRKMGLSDIRLARLKGLAAFFKGFSVDVE